MVYGYIVLCVGCYASYKGAPAASLLIVAALLTLPNVRWDKMQSALSVETLAKSLNGLAFALIAYGLGRGISLLLGV